MEKAHHTRRLPDHPAFRLPRQRHVKRLLTQAFAWIILLALGGIWVYAWQNARAHRLQMEVNELQLQLSTAPQMWAKNNQYDDVRTGMVGLGSGVSLAVPAGWELQSPGADCPPPHGQLDCLDRRVLGPKRGDAAQIAVDVTLYQNSEGLYAKAWFLNVYGANKLSGPGSVIEERAIHGQSAVYALLRTESTQDLYYVVSSAERAAVVHARIFTAGNSDADFRSAAPAVEAIANDLQLEEQHD